MNEIARIENPLAGEVAARPAQGALAHTDQQRAVAEVQAAMMIARANPRDERAAIDRILNACQRQGLAEAAVYSYSRGGSEISGPSIRLAEALAQTWGNLQFGIRELEQRGGESTVQAFAWDVETNVRREMTFTVPHLRHTKKGSYRLEDPRDIYEMVANNGARRLRACILAVIPGDVTDVAVRQCEETMRARADTSPEGIQKLVNAFAEFGVGQQQLETRIQRRIESIQPAQVVALKKIYVSLRDGMSQVVDWFEPAVDTTAEVGQPQTGNAAAKAALAAATKPKIVTEHSPETGEIIAEAGESAVAAATDRPTPEGTDGEADSANLPTDQETTESVTLADEHPASRRANELIAEFAKASTIIDVGAIYKRGEKDIEAMPDDLREAVEKARDEAETRLKPTKAKAKTEAAAQ